MNNVTAHIEYLLLFRDCVIVPSFGAVLAHCAPARYDSASGEFMPPRREFSFNGSLTRGDGLLVASVARREGISYEAASRIVAEGVESMKRQLAADGVLPLGRIGVLKNGNSGTPVFEPFPASGIYPVRGWLEPVKIKEQNVGHISASEGRQATASVRRRRPLSSYIKVAASLVLVLGIAVAATLRMKDYNQHAVQQASLVPDAMATAAPLLVERPGTASAPLLLVLRRHADAAVTVDTTTYHPDAAAVPASLRDAYFMIVASLASRSDAEKFLAENGDKNLRILEFDGRFRIYAASAPNTARLRAIADEAGVHERYPSAWICHRK